MSGAVREQLIARLRDALARELPYAERPPSPQGRRAAVLALFGEDEAGGYSLLFTRRTETLETHKGQISFPGGSRDETDPDDAFTALRETHEEVGIPPAQVEVLGALPALWTVTGFWVTPFVGLLRAPIADLRLEPNPHEIAEVFWAPLARLEDPATYEHEYRQFGAIRYPTHVFTIAGHRIWGATGAMVKNLLDRLAASS
jgi:8-oxo-dGTP pyrophosphatase MutT (NUDIX family)